MPKANRRNGLMLRQAGKLKRDLIFIGCEGEKTERGYFEKLRSLWRPNAIVEICPVKTGPKMLEEMKRIASKRDLQVDEFWCVFDEDGDQRFREICEHFKSEYAHLACSAPCFEFWLLLHFSDSTRGYSNCKEVSDALRKHFPAYQKNKSCFEELLPRLDAAIVNAQKLEQFCESEGKHAPCTRVHHLVLRLRELSA